MTTFPKPWVLDVNNYTYETGLSQLFDLQNKESHKEAYQYFLRFMMSLNLKIPAAYNGLKLPKSGGELPEFISKFKENEFGNVCLMVCTISLEKKVRDENWKKLRDYHMGHVTDSRWGDLLAALEKHKSKVYSNGYGVALGLLGYTFSKLINIINILLVTNRPNQNSSYGTEEMCDLIRYRTIPPQSKNDNDEYDEKHNSDSEYSSSEADSDQKYSTNYSGKWRPIYTGQWKDVDLQDGIYLLLTTWWNNYHHRDTNITSHQLLLDLYLKNTSPPDYQSKTFSENAEIDIRKFYTYAVQEPVDDEKETKERKQYIYWTKQFMMDWTIYFTSNNNNIISTTHHVLMVNMNKFYARSFLASPDCQEKPVLFPFQKTIIDVICRLPDNGNMLVISRTGSGKTRIVTSLLGELYRNNDKVICVVKDRQLQNQLYSEMYKYTNPFSEFLNTTDLDSLQEGMSTTNGERSQDLFNKSYLRKVLICTMDEIDDNAEVLSKQNKLRVGFEILKDDQKYYRPSEVTVIIDEIHLLEGGPAEFQNLKSWLAKHKKDFRRLIGLTATTEIKVNQGKIQFHSIYDRIMKDNFKYIYYDKEDGFARVEIENTVTVNIQKGSYLKKFLTQTFTDTDNRWVQLALVRQQLPDAVLNFKVDFYYRQHLEHHGLKTYDEEDIDNEDVLGMIYEENNLPMYFSFCSHILQLVQEHPNKRFLILSDTMSGMYGIYQSLKTAGVLVQKIQLNAPQTLEWQMEIFSDQLSDIKHRVLVYDVQQYAEGTNIWNIDVIINTSDYNGDYKKYLQALGRANRICKPSPLIDGETERNTQFIAGRGLQVHNLVCPHSIQEKLFKKVMNDVRIRNNHQNLINHNSIINFEGSSIVLK